MAVAGRVSMSALRMPGGHSPDHATEVPVPRLSPSGFGHRRYRAAQDQAAAAGLVLGGPVNAPFHPVLDGVHLLISNLKTWLRGRFHGVSCEYLQAYVSEFLYRIIGDDRRRTSSGG